MKDEHNALRHSIFGAPALIGIASLVGLVIGLLGDGPLDLFSWLALGIPVVAIGWALAYRRQ